MNRHNSLSELRDRIAKHFNLGEIDSLCFDLAIPFEELPGNTLSLKSQQLVEWCNRRGKIAALKLRCKELRLHLDWSESETPGEQMLPKLRIDKLRFLYWLYIEVQGNSARHIFIENIARSKNMTEKEVADLANYLQDEHLVKFEGRKIWITHFGVVKLEHDLLEARLLTGDISDEVLAEIEKDKLLRIEFLWRLYEVSKERSFEGVDFNEIANFLKVNYGQFDSYLKGAGWISARGVPDIQITEKGKEVIEENLMEYQTIPTPISISPIELRPFRQPRTSEDVWVSVKVMNRTASQIECNGYLEGMILLKKDGTEVPLDIPYTQLGWKWGTARGEKEIPSGQFWFLDVARTWIEKDANRLFITTQDNGDTYPQEPGRYKIRVRVTVNANQETIGREYFEGEVNYSGNTGLFID